MLCEAFFACRSGGAGKGRVGQDRVRLALDEVTCSCFFSLAPLGSCKHIKASALPPLYLQPQQPTLPYTFLQLPLHFYTT